MYSIEVITLIAAFISPLFISILGILQCGSCCSVEMLCFFLWTLFPFFAHFPSLHSTLISGTHLLLLDFISLPPSFPSLCISLIFPIVLQGTHRVLWFPLIICIKGLCFQTFSVFLMSVIVSRELFSDCYLLLPIKSFKYLSLFPSLPLPLSPSFSSLLLSLLSSAKN